MVAPEYLEQAQTVIRTVDESQWSRPNLYYALRAADWRSFPHTHVTFQRYLDNAFLLAKCLEDHPNLYDLIMSTCNTAPPTE